MNDVAITGIGPICSLGVGAADFLAGLDEGRAGLRELGRVPATGFPGLHAAECLDFAVEDYLESEKTYLDRASELALAGCHLALEDAGIDRAGLDKDRFGLALGTAYGCLDSMARHTERLAQKGAKFTSPVIFQHSYANTPTSLCAIEYDIQGPAATFCDRALSGATAVQYAFDLLRADSADVVLAGGVEALSPTLLEGWRETGLLDRPGFVPGEGAGLLALETAAHAANRQARVRARLLAVSVVWDEDPWAAGLRAMETALAEAGNPQVSHFLYGTEGLVSLAELSPRALAETMREAETRMPETLFGQTFAAGPGLSLAWACHTGGCALLGFVDPGGGAAALVVEAAA
jgi:3-oxoacyl-[acyl-carrier-protein] synthase II